MLHKLVFDTTDANTIADSAHVGSHMLDGLGNLLTSADGSHATVANNAIQALDTRGFMYAYDGTGGDWVRLTETGGALDINVKSGELNVDLDGVYVLATNPTPDSVGTIFHSRAASPAISDQIFRSTGGVASADAIVAANVHGIDVNSFGMLFNGTTWDRWQGTGGSANVTISGGTVDVSDAALANTAITANTTSLAVANTAQAAVAAPLANRKYLSIYNNDNRTMYIGPTGVSASTGFPIPPGSLVDLRAGAAVVIDAVSPKAAHDLRYMELS